jgi:hypothetical protein
MLTPKIDIPDVDLDVANYDEAVAALSGFVHASEEHNGRLTKHKNGIYFQNIPTDAVTGYAAYPYKIAEDLNYYKVDILHVRVYEMVENEKELETLLGAPIDWSWFTDERFFENDDPRYKLTHLAKHYYLCEQYPPQSIDDVAVLLAVIRPRKTYLIGRPWEEIKEFIWQKIPKENPNNDPKKYFFKKSHGVAYALLATLHAKLIARHLEGYEHEDDYFV